ncbi:neprilysin-3 [Drosophila obscura]|uniref:neprilysin-3 n=1 Tax=Drosophila obscura TaxID=7282 RepID=UPI001BB1CE2F|nr:neprilysin-3 [Drosophila obscura]
MKMKLPRITWTWLGVLLLLLGHWHCGECDAEAEAETALDWELGNCQRQMENEMDTTEAACDNFHQYACGNWHANSSQRAFGAHDMRTKWAAGHKQRLVRHFEGLPPTAEPDQLATFYGSCMSDQQSLHVYTEALERRGYWPLVSNASASFDWVATSAGLRRFGAQSLWRLLVQPNWQAADQSIFYLLPPDFALLGSNSMSEFLYQRYLKSLLLELGVRVRRAAALAERLVEFERELRQLLPAEQTLVLREPQPLSQLVQQLPQLQLRRYFDLLLQGLPSGDTDKLLVVADQEYLGRLQRLLQRTDGADPLVLSTWLLLQLPAHFELHLHDDDKLVVRQRHCLEQLSQLLPRQLAQLHIRLVLGDDPAVYEGLVLRVQRLFRRLQQQFERQLNETDVFEADRSTQTLAIQKLRDMRLLLPKTVAEAQPQSGAQPLSSNYDENLLQLSHNRALAEFRKVIDCQEQACDGSPPVEGLGLGLDPLSVNAYYRLRQNAVELPLGLLTTPSVMPWCVNTTDLVARQAGAMGSILGHEMMHALDYDGINYDASGQLANGQWPPRAIIRFGLRAGCYLGARYSNATLTINENMADTEGLRLAFEGYRLQRANRGVTDPRGLKTFFVAFAQNWCGSAASPLGAAGAGAGQHATHAERVNNVLGNFPEFLEVFQCKAGSRMSSPDKCRIW